MNKLKLTEVSHQITQEKKDIEILSTGIKMIDNLLEGGFLKKELVLLGGKTAGGKSFFATTIFANMATQGKVCAYFSLEISNQMIVSRLVGARANISPTRIMIKILDIQEEARKIEAQSDLTVYDEFMYFYDDLYELEAIEEEIRENKYDFVVIDFIQNIMAKKADEYERLSYVALRLQKIAKETNCCILALSQLSNQMARDKKNNDIVEYKGSGAIGHAADLGFFIEDTGIEGYLNLRLRKNRRGISGSLFGFQIMSPGGRIIESV